MHPKLNSAGATGLKKRNGRDKSVGKDESRKQFSGVGSIRIKVGSPLGVRQTVQKENLSVLHEEMVNLLEFLSKE